MPVCDRPIQGVRNGRQLDWLNQFKQKAEIEFDCALRAEVIDTVTGGRLCCILAHGAISQVPGDKTRSVVLSKSRELLELFGCPATFNCKEDLPLKSVLARDLTQRVLRQDEQAGEEHNAYCYYYSLVAVFVCRADFFPRCIRSNRHFGGLRPAIASHLRAADPSWRRLPVGARLLGL